MYTHEYEEVAAYYKGKRVWAELAEGSETVIRISEGALPPSEDTWTTGLWALVTVDAFRFFRSGRTDGEYHVKLSGVALPSRMEWFYIEDSVRGALLELVERAHAPQ